jgi:hypothetical protein
MLRRKDKYAWTRLCGLGGVEILRMVTPATVKVFDFYMSPEVLEWS